MRWLCWIWIPVAVWLSGCTTLTHPSLQVARVPDSSEVTAILSQICHENDEMTTFKGTGKLKIWSNGKNQIVRAAWTGARPDKIRIVIQGVTGVPVAGMAADGAWYYLQSYSENSFYKAEARNPDMEKLVSIPVTVEDIIRLVSGGIPVRPYFSSRLNRISDTSGYLLSLLGEEGNAIENILLDNNRSHVRHIEIFTPKGTLAYRVDFAGKTEIEGFRVPERLVFGNDKGSGFQLDMDQYWPNAPVSPEMFVITP